MTGSTSQNPSGSNLESNEISDEVENGKIIKGGSSGSFVSDIKLVQNTTKESVEKPSLDKTKEMQKDVNSGQINSEAEDVPQFIKEQHVEKSSTSAKSFPQVQANQNPEEVSTSKELQVQNSDEGEVVPLPEVIATEKKEFKKKKRIIWSDVFSCWVLGMGALLLVLLLLLLLLIKSGMLNVPYLSDWFYDAPVPTRYVEAGSMSWDDFRDLVSVRLSENNLDNEPPIPLKISEKEFTAFLHGVIAGGLRNSEYKSEVAQVVVLPNSIEMYFYLTWHDYITFEILTHLVPIVEDDGTLRFEVVDAKFGDLPLPGDWIIQLVGFVFARDIGVWKIILSNGYGMQSSVLSNRSVEFLIGPVLVK